MLAFLTKALLVARARRESQARPRAESWFFVSMLRKGTIAAVALGLSCIYRHRLLLDQSAQNMSPTRAWIAACLFLSEQ